jgi:hypothetical protein
VLGDEEGAAGAASGSRAHAKPARGTPAGEEAGGRGSGGRAQHRAAPAAASPPPAVAPRAPRAQPIAPGDSRRSPLLWLLAALHLLCLSAFAYARFAHAAPLLPPAATCAAAAAALPEDVLALQQRLASLEARLASLSAAPADAPPSQPAEPAPGCASCGVDGAALSREVGAALDLFWADRTGRADYALATAGARVLAHSPLHASQPLARPGLAARLRAAPPQPHPRADEARAEHACDACTCACAALPLALASLLTLLPRAVAAHRGAGGARALPGAQRQHGRVC